MKCRQRERIEAARKEREDEQRQDCVASQRSRMVPQDAPADDDLQGHGLMGKLVAPMARSQARKEIPKDQQRLKERLEAGV